MFGAAASAAGHHSVAFVAPAAIDAGLAEALGLTRPLVPVADTRGIGKSQMRLNDALPEIRVDASAFTVTIDGELIEPDPATELPLAQRYNLF